MDSLKDEFKDKDYEKKVKAEAYARSLKRKELLSKGIDISKDNSIAITELDKRLGVRRIKPQTISKEQE
jgi:hypothetical protein